MDIGDLITPPESWGEFLKEFHRQIVPERFYPQTTALAFAEATLRGYLPDSHRKDAYADARRKGERLGPDGEPLPALEAHPRDTRSLAWHEGDIDDFCLYLHELGSKGISPLGRAISRRGFMEVMRELRKIALENFDKRSWTVVADRHTGKLSVVEGDVVPITDGPNMPAGVMGATFGESAWRTEVPDAPAGK